MTPLRRKLVAAVEVKFTIASMSSDTKAKTNARDYE
jgi:hypothetical protein